MVKRIGQVGSDHIEGLVCKLLGVNQDGPGEIEAAGISVEASVVAVASPDLGGPGDDAGVGDCGGAVGEAGEVGGGVRPGREIEDIDTGPFTDALGFFLGAICPDRLNVTNLRCNLRSNLRSNLSPSPCKQAGAGAYTVQAVQRTTSGGCRGGGNEPPRDALGAVGDVRAG
jgi:hypothetical protein